MIIEPENKKEAQPQQKYPKPKILLIDLPADCIDSVKSGGFNASSGSFGSPYKVEMKDVFLPLIGEPFLPNFTEQEIIFIDLTPPQTLENPKGEKKTSPGEEDYWTKCSLGIIDPRPKYIIMVRKYFDRIFDNGGMFVIFAQPRIQQELNLGHIVNGYLDIRSKISNRDNWSFLSILDKLIIDSDFGIEISVPNHDHQIFHFFRKNIKDAKYTATFNPKYIEKSWIPLLSNKFEGSNKLEVGGLIAPEDTKGRILILPQLSNKSEAIDTLLREVLPVISPHLFPHIEGARWVEKNEYELDSVLKYKAEKIKVQERAKKELKELDEKISEERNKLSFLHGIITKTDDDLVVDIKSCLELVEFKQVIDVDEQIKKQGTKASKQEDLQIHDKSPILLIEVKGLSRPPNESDTTQVVKYISRRRKEWNRFDVLGVSIIVP